MQQTGSFYPQSGQLNLRISASAPNTAQNALQVDENFNMTGSNFGPHRISSSLPPVYQTRVEEASQQPSIFKEVQQDPTRSNSHSRAGSVISRTQDAGRVGNGIQNIAEEPLNARSHVSVAAPSDLRRGDLEKGYMSDIGSGYDDEDVEEYVFYSNVPSRAGSVEDFDTYDVSSDIQKEYSDPAKVLAEQRKASATNNRFSEQNVKPAFDNIDVPKAKNDVAVAKEIQEQEYAAAAARARQRQRERKERMEKSKTRSKSDTKTHPSGSSKKTGAVLKQNPNLPKALYNPKIRKQLAKLRRHRPIFIYAVTAAQTILLGLSILFNWQIFGEPIQMNPLNPMIGPDSQAR